MSAPFHLTSRLDADHRASLEALLFFNVRQHALRSQIEATIARFGVPEIVEKNGWLGIAVAGLEDVQCLYAVRAQNGEPVGAVVYARDSIDRITVVHLSVASDSALNLEGGGRMVLHSLMQQIRRVARSTSGIRRVELAYRTRRPAAAAPGFAAAP